MGELRDEAIAEIKRRLAQYNAELSMLRKEGNLLLTAAVKRDVRELREMLNGLMLK